MRFRRVIMVLLLLFTFTAVGVALSDPAVAAKTCTQADSNHCYGMVTSASAEGGSAYFTANCWTSNVPGTYNFITNEMWATSDEENAWVEAGYIDQASSGAANGVTGALKSIFWGEQTPSGAWHAGELDGSPYTSDVYISITRNPSPNEHTWTIYVDTGFHLFSETPPSNSMDPTDQLELGSEVTTGDLNAYSMFEQAAVEYQAYDPSGSDNGQWYSGTPSTVARTYSRDVDETFSWNHDYYDLTAGVPC